MLARRFAPLIAAAFLPLALQACAGAQRDMQAAFTPGVREDAKIHTYQVASFVHAFSEGHARSWSARLDAVERDALPLLDLMAQSPYRLELDVVAHQNKSRDMEYEYYDVNGVLAPRSGKGDKFVLPGAQGTDPAAYEAALAPAAAAAKVPAEKLKKGHFALFALVTMMGELNATDDSMRRMAFGLLVLKNKLKSGERADYLAPMRPADKSIEDVDIALKVVGEHHANTSRLRAEVLACMALLRDYDAPEARKAFGEQVAESRKGAKVWTETHPRPVMEQYGVAWKPFKLPTPDAMLEVLDKDGYITAAIQVAKGVATGSPGATIEGFGKLAPKNSSLRVAANGVAAAMRGDVMGTADAVIELAGRQPDVAPIADRLKRVQSAVGDVKAGVATIQGGAATIQGGAATMQKGVTSVPAGAAGVQNGVQAVQNGAAGVAGAGKKK